MYFGNSNIFIPLLNAENQRDSVLRELTMLANDTLARVEKFSTGRVEVTVPKKEIIKPTPPVGPSTGTAKTPEKDITSITEEANIEDEQIEEPVKTEESKEESMEVSFEVNTNFEETKQEEKKQEEPKEEPKKEGGSFFDHLA